MEFHTQHRSRPIEFSSRVRRHGPESRKRFLQRWAATRRSAAPAPPAGRILLNVFVTDDGTEQGSGPILFLPWWRDAVLPPNPRGYEWRYFATIEDDDSLLAGEHVAALAAIEEDGFYIANRLISIPLAATKKGD